MTRPTADLSVYLVTDRDQCAARGVEAVVQAAVRGGVTMVQLRDKQAADGDLIARAKALKALLAPHGVPLIINDRVDVALAADADGVHVGQEDGDPATARRRLGPGKIVGVSVSLPQEVASADPAIVDYAGVGAVFETATKAKTKPPLGIEGFASLRARVPVPVVAIGGVKRDHVADLIRGQANGVAVVSAICAAEDPEAAARALVDAVADARAGLEPTGG